MRHSCLTHSYTAASMAGASCFTFHTSLIINPLLPVDKDKGNCCALSGRKKNKRFISVTAQRMWKVAHSMCSCDQPKNAKFISRLTNNEWSDMGEFSAWGLFNMLLVNVPGLECVAITVGPTLLPDKSINIRWLWRNPGKCGFLQYLAMATMLWLKVQHKKFSLEKTCHVFYFVSLPSVCCTCSCACKRSWELKRSKCAPTGALE